MNVDPGTGTAPSEPHAERLNFDAHVDNFTEFIVQQSTVEQPAWLFRARHSINGHRLSVIFAAAGEALGNAHFRSAAGVSAGRLALQKLESLLRAYNKANSLLEANDELLDTFVREMVNTLRIVQEEVLVIAVEYTQPADKKQSAQQLVHTIEQSLQAHCGSTPPPATTTMLGIFNARMKCDYVDAGVAKHFSILLDGGESAARHDGVAHGKEVTIQLDIEECPATATMDRLHKIPSIVVKLNVPERKEEALCYQSLPQAIAALRLRDDGFVVASRTGGQGGNNLLCIIYVL